MGKSNISMVIFHSYVKLPEGTTIFLASPAPGALSQIPRHSARCSAAASPELRRPRWVPSCAATRAPRRSSDGQRPCRPAQIWDPDLYTRNSQINIDIHINIYIYICIYRYRYRYIYMGYKWENNSNIITWSDMMWCDMMWCDMIWYDNYSYMSICQIPSEMIMI